MSPREITRNLGRGRRCSPGLLRAVPCPIPAQDRLYAMRAGRDAGGLTSALIPRRAPALRAKAGHQHEGGAYAHPYNRSCPSHGRPHPGWE